MATTITKTIGSGGDYATPALWIAGCPANLVTADQIWRGELLNQTFSGTGNMLTISGITTDATRYVELTVAAGASFADAGTPVLRLDSSKGALITSSVDNVGVAVIINAVAYTRFSRLQVESTVTSTAARAIVLAGAWADSCIFEGATGAFGGGVVSINGGKMSNFVVCCRSSGESELINCNSASSTFTNGMLVVPSDKTAATSAFRMSYGSISVKNVAALGVTNLVQGTGGSISNGGGNRTSIAGNPSSWTTVTYNTALVVQTTDSGRDFSPTNGSSGLYGVTADTTNAAKDILGYTRPTGAGLTYAGARHYVTGSTPVAFAGTVSNQTHTQNTGGFSLDVSSYFSGSLTPYTYNVQSGTLPTGLTLNTSTGVISGTPTVVQNQTGITIRATDTGTNTATSNSFAINITAPTSGALTSKLMQLGF